MQQDSELPAEEVYIRYAAEVPSLDSIIHDEDDLEKNGDPIRIIICMNKESSKRLAGAQFLQSNIGFKRIVGFQEFELGGRDPGSRTGVFLFIIFSMCLTDSVVQLSPIVVCISIVKQPLLITLSLRRSRRSLALTLAALCNGVTCMPGPCKNLLAFCTGQWTNTEVRWKVQTFS
jgi:hypothetical protein